MAKIMRLIREASHARKVDCPEAEEVYEVMGVISMPSYDERIYFPKVRNGKDFVHGLNHKQSVLLGQLITEKVGQRYMLLPLQVSYEYLSRPNDGEIRAIFCNNMMYNREVMLKQGAIMPDPVVYVDEEDGALCYRGDVINADIDECSLTRTMKKVGLFNKWNNEDIDDRGVCFEGKESAVQSDWNEGPYCFAARADDPSDRKGFIAVFVKGGK